MARHLYLSTVTNKYFGNIVPTATRQLTQMLSFFISYVSMFMWWSTNCSVYPFFRQHIVWKSRRRVKQRRRRRREGHGGGRGGGGVDSSGGGSAGDDGGGNVSVSPYSYSLFILFFLIRIIFFASSSIEERGSGVEGGGTMRRRGSTATADDVALYWLFCYFCTLWNKLTFPFNPFSIIGWHGWIGGGGGRGNGRGSGGGVKGKATLIWDHVSLNLYRLFILFTSFFNSDVFLIRILSFVRRWRQMRRQQR